MKYALLILISLTLTACGNGIPSSTKTDEMKTRCIYGVEYFVFKEKRGYQGFGFMTVKYRRDGSVATCADQFSN